MSSGLEFDMTLISANPIDGSTRSAIHKLFLGKDGYKKLQIVQDDISDVIFDTIFTSATNKFVGNVQRGITLHGKCNSPYQRTATKELTYSFDGNNVVNQDIEFYNQSDNSDYIYPIVEFELNSVGNFFQLTNITDDNRIFLFTDLLPNETITVDNFHQTVVSDTGLTRLSRFNKNFFRLRSGYNKLNVQSGIGTFTMTYQLVRNIGA
jgi:hypothetical protein